MARDVDALLLRKWAATSTLVETPEDAGLDRAVGFPASYGVDMARMLATWQQQMREVSAAFVEAAERGILEWSADQRYEHPAWVTGSDGNLYQTVMSSGGDDPSEDPVGDTEEACWSLFEVTVPESSTTQRGTIETATNTEAQTGTDDERAVPPSGLAVAIEEFTPNSNTTRRGIVEQATVAESVAGTDTQRAVTPEGVAAAIAAAPRPLWL